MNKFMVTDQYIELEIKARLFAAVFDYDVVIVQGAFSFYNSPSFRSFSFNVMPDVFVLDAGRFLWERFTERVDK